MIRVESSMKFDEGHCSVVVYHPTTPRTQSCVFAQTEEETRGLSMKRFPLHVREQNYSNSISPGIIISPFPPPIKSIKNIKDTGKKER